MNFAKLLIIENVKKRVFFLKPLKLCYCGMDINLFGQYYPIGKNRLKHRLNDITLNAQTLPGIGGAKPRNRTKHTLLHFVNGQEFRSRIYPNLIYLFLGIFLTAGYKRLNLKASARNLNMSKPSSVFLGNFIYPAAEAVLFFLFGTVFLYNCNKLLYAAKLKSGTEITGKNISFPDFLSYIFLGNNALFKVFLH